MQEAQLSGNRGLRAAPLHVTEGGSKASYQVKDGMTDDRIQSCMHTGEAQKLTGRKKQSGVQP